MMSNMPGGIFHKGNSVEGESAHHLQGTNRNKPGWDYAPSGPPEDMATDALANKWGAADDRMSGDARTRSLRVKKTGKSPQVTAVWKPAGQLQRTSSGEGATARKSSGTLRPKGPSVGGNSLDRPIEGGDRQAGEPVKGPQGLDRPKNLGGDRPAESLD